MRAVNNQPSNSTPNWNFSGRRSPRSGAKTARQFLYWLAMGVALIVAIANMTPYMKAANFVLVELFDLKGLWAFFGNKALGIISIVVGGSAVGLYPNSRNLSHSAQA